MEQMRNPINYVTIPGVVFPDITKDEADRLRKMPEEKVTVFIMKRICELCKVDLVDVRKKTRYRPRVRARQLMMYYMDLYMRMPQREIGILLSSGKKPFDHSTIIHARDTIKDMLASRSSDEYTVTTQEIHETFITDLKHFIFNESHRTNW